MQHSSGCCLGVAAFSVYHVINRVCLSWGADIAEMPRLSHNTSFSSRRPSSQTSGWYRSSLFFPKEPRTHPRAPILPQIFPKTTKGKRAKSGVPAFSPTTEPPKDQAASPTVSGMCGGESRWPLHREGISDIDNVKAVEHLWKHHHIQDPQFHQAWGPCCWEARHQLNPFLGVRILCCRHEGLS